MEAVKRFFRTNALTKNIYNDLHNLKLERKRKIIYERGPETVIMLEKILEKSNCLFFFDMGTLLGIIREGKLLSHDLDIDIAIYAATKEKQDCIRKLICDAGCILIKSYYVDGVGRTEDSFYYDGIRFDINYYYRLNEKEDSCFLFAPYDEEDEISNIFSVLELKCSAIKSTKSIDFYSTRVTIPGDPEKYLKERYGQSWRIPDKNYKYWKGPSVYAFKEKGHVQHAI